MKPVLLSLLLLSSATNIDAQRIDISTSKTDLILKVGDNKRLYQTYLGEKLLNKSDGDILPWHVKGGSDGSVSERGWEVYPGSGAEDYYEPALAMTHYDGNLTTILQYSDHTQQQTPFGAITEIRLKDKLYPVEVTLHYESYYKENIIKTWATISNNGKSAVALWRYASAMLYFNRSEYYLTEFSSDWAKEAQMRTQPLCFGKKVIDTKLGSRAAMHTHPFFEIGLDTPASENRGEVLMGTLAWTGNFQFTFEVDNVGNLRILPSINPYASTYEVAAKESFATPEFIFTLSQHGTSEGSRDLQRWARLYQLKDGMGDRMTLLNNWENTYFDFDQNLLAQLMNEAKELGVDMFLLDDGWFGNKHPRKNDRAGLGDWQPTKSKLPGGIHALTESAKTAGVKFGLWIEPEMVNPKSELFEKHPDWAYTLPDRKTYYYRNQLVLDLNNPEVQEHVYKVVEDILRNNPDVAYFKWDCNSPITNIFSHYLKEKQQQLYIGHVRGLYKVLQRIKKNFPDTPMMLCSGGGARCDYEALKYFTEFWCSDNTDPVERLFIQWGFSQFFPAKAMCAHVTSWNKQTSVKFRTDVASMGKLGFDIGLKDLSPTDLLYVQNAIKNWNRLKPAILDGVQYRLVSPYESNHTATMYTTEDATKAVLFAFDIHPRFAEKLHKVKLQGLIPTANYRVKEINVMPMIDTTKSAKQRSSAAPNPSYKSTWASDNKVFSGDFLMKVGLDVFTAQETQSHVIELTKE
ncbi:alpha-galactosidase [Prevotella sp. PINT]|jgi:Alpha-galactosidase|uniref:alpha-galactosidase n=1 Tax=Palleniella intestinalis TaxID=2736291 RepID=UPI00155574A0|nr:alpha-galactosidase [Palleniella intestinalis]NPD82287.1 alpha-galactosidase [Palleniella intestinalis]